MLDESPQCCMDLGNGVLGLSGGELEGVFQVTLLSFPGKPTVHGPRRRLVRILSKIQKDKTVDFALQRWNCGPAVYHLTEGV